MFNRIRNSRSTRQASTRTTLSKIGFDMLETRQMLTGSAVLFNPATSAEPATQTADILLTNPYTSPVTIDLAIDQLGTGNGTLSQYSVTLPAMGHQNVTFTPSADSSAPDDVHVTLSEGGLQYGESDISVVSVTFPKDINALDTPAGMKDRIPPRVDTSVPVTVSPSLTGSGETVGVTVIGTGSNHGTTTFVGANSFSSSTIVEIQGVNQTAVSATLAGTYAGNLQLAAVVRGNTTGAKSNGFSVAAIPVAVQDSFRQDYSLVDPTYRGIQDYVLFTSDSGVNSDLSGVKVLEEIYDDPSSQTGVFIGTHPIVQADYNSLTLSGGQAYTFDNDAVLASYLASSGGSNIIDQVYLFQDYRTGTTNAVVANSGFEFTYTIQPDPITSVMTLYIDKYGAVETVNLYSTDAATVNDPSGHIKKQYTA